MTRFVQGFTQRGRWFLITGLALGLSAVVGGSTDLLRVGLLLFLLPLISLLVAVRSRVQLTAGRTISPRLTEAGNPATVDITLQNMARIPTGVLLVEDTVPFTLGNRPRFVLDHAISRFRRRVTYSVRADVRGRYVLGPLTVRLTDPFGLIELRRAFRESSTLIVTPTVHSLPSVRLSGEWSGSGESRPRAIASAGEDDVTIRGYRHGDDMRRVHWRATAHHGELMVRREEMPWQSRASVLLDTRTAGHAGQGRDSSLEWAVSATASIGVHLAGRGYAVRLITDDGGTVSGSWHDPSSGPVDAEAPLLEALAVVEAHRSASVGQWSDLLTGAGSASGLLVAVLGQLSPEEARVVAKLRHGATAAMAIMLDTTSWLSVNERARSVADVRLTEAAQVLRRSGWGVVTAGRTDRIADVWESLGVSRSGAPAAGGTVHRSATRAEAAAGARP